MNTSRRTRRVQFEDVDAAARELLREGTRPTVRRVRDKIGGSPNDLTPLLASWFAHVGEELARSPDAPAAAALPAAAPPSVWAVPASAGPTLHDAPLRGADLLLEAEGLLRAARQAQVAAEQTIARLTARLEAAERELARLRLTAGPAALPAEPASPPHSHLN